MIEVFKVCLKNQLSDNVSYVLPEASCNPTSRKLESCNHCCMLGLLNNHVLR